MPALHTKKLFEGRETAEENFQRLAIPKTARCHGCAGGHPVEMAYFWVSAREISVRMPEILATTPAEVIAQKKIQFDFGGGPEFFLHWTTFYFCSGCKADGEKQLARNREIDALGFLEWKRGPGRDKPMSQVPDALVGAGIRGPTGGSVERGMRPIQRSAILNPKTGAGFEPSSK